MELGLRGRTALITGASQGIGRAVAELFAEEGVGLDLVSRTASDLESLAADLRRRHRVAVTVHPMNLAERGRARELAERCPNVDIVVNSAGSIPRGSVADVDEERWRAAWDLKVFGYINMCREYFARMSARRRGVIINIIGNGGEKLDFHYIAGSTGNAALMAFTKALGGASADYGVRVVGVNPGPVATERLVTLMKTAARTKFNDESRWQELERGFPFARAATVDEVAATVALLASDRSSYTTGTIVTIDGGMANKGSLI